MDSKYVYTLLGLGPLGVHGRAADAQPKEVGLTRMGVNPKSNHFSAQATLNPVINPRVYSRAEEGFRVNPG